jgi:hypothetical protein
MELNFWDLNYVLYIAGFLFVPRLTMIFVFSNYVTDGFKWHNIFAGITIWWMYPLLGLGFWSKLIFMFFLGLFPRLLLGIVGYKYLSPDNHIPLIAFCAIGVLIDITVKMFNRIMEMKSD